MNNPERGANAPKKLIN